MVRQRIHLVSYTLNTGNRNYEKHTGSRNHHLYTGNRNCSLSIGSNKYAWNSGGRNYATNTGSLLYQLTSVAHQGYKNNVLNRLCWPTNHISRRRPSYSGKKMANEPGFAAHSFIPKRNQRRRMGRPGCIGKSHHTSFATEADYLDSNICSC